MVLKLKRREDVTFEAYEVTSHHFALGGIWILDHSLNRLWGWSIGNVHVHSDGHGNCQGGAGGRDEAMAMFAHRWRTWLGSAGLREIDPASPKAGGPPAPLTLGCGDDRPSAGYRVESRGVPIGVIRRTYGVDTSRWYWSLSAITVPVEERPAGTSHPCGGGATAEEALAGLAARWRVWLDVAGLGAELPQTKV
jgi:hypothetical protein